MSETTGANIKLQLGEWEIIGLTDRLGPFPFPVDKVFPTVPAEEWAKIRDRYPTSFSGPGTLQGRVSCYLIRSPGRTILVDTGLGPNFPTAPSVLVQAHLLEGLRQAGITPGEVDTVFLTHLHQDHLSWNMQHGEGKAQPTFPRARYITHGVEWAMSQHLLAANPDAAAYVREQIEPLQAWGMLSLVEGESGLAEGIRAIPTPGHSPGHMSLLVEANPGARLLILGDAFYHPLQLTEPTYHFVLDADVPLANAIRAQLLERIEAEDIIITACHFPEPGFGWVRQDGLQRVWQPHPAGLWSAL